jgi:hypothetical protein
VTIRGVSITHLSPNALLEMSDGIVIDVPIADLRDERGVVNETQLLVRARQVAAEVRANPEQVAAARARPGPGKPA